METYRYDLTVRGATYRLHSVGLSAKAAEALRVLRRYFRILFDPGVSFADRRRKAPFDFADTVVRMLCRAKMFIDKGHPAVAGSMFIGSKSWAVFGVNPEVDAVHRFHDFNALVDHYADRIGGPTAKFNFRFRESENLFSSLSHDCHLAPGRLMSLAVLFVRDLVLYCGPDVDEFFDLFSNSLADMPDGVNLEQWDDCRCRLMGRFGAVDWASYGAVTAKPRPRKVGRVVTKFVRVYAGFAPPDKDAKPPDLPLVSRPG